jgi:hypothetical protein
MDNLLENNIETLTDEQTFQLTTSNLSIKQVEKKYVAKINLPTNITMNDN